MNFASSNTNFGLQGQGQAAINGVPRAVTVQSSLEDFDPLIGRLETLASQLGNLADRIAGAVPVDPSGDTKAIGADNLIGAIQMRRERLLSIVNRVENYLQRAATALV